MRSPDRPDMKEVMDLSCARLVVLGGALLAQGCAAGTTVPVMQPTAPAAESRPVERHGPAHTEADVEFMRHMLFHHAQALEMTALVPERAASDAVRLLAERMEVSQRDEMDRMAQWLRTRRLEVPAMAGDLAPDPAAGREHAEMHARHHGAGGSMMMPGMLTPVEMEHLASTSGPEFDRLFLESMIRHHEGALVMVAELFASPGAGQEPEIYQFASEVDADQRMEIDRMRRLLDTLSR